MTERSDQGDSSNAIEDFSDTGMWAVRSTLLERYGREMELPPGDAELRLSRQHKHLTVCPVVAWQDENCTPAVFKCGVNTFRSQFFYRLNQQYGSGSKGYDNLAECMVTQLQMQADHHRNEQLAAEAER